MMEHGASSNPYFQALLLTFQQTPNNANTLLICLNILLNKEKFIVLLLINLLFYAVSYNIYLSILCLTYLRNLFLNEAVFCNACSLWGVLQL